MITLAEPDLPSPALLDRLRAELEPRGRIGEIRRLGGGISSFMHAVELIGPSGQRREVVVRRYGDERLELSPHVATQECCALEHMHAAGVPVPELLLADPDGSVLGGPGVVTSLLRGRPLLTPRDPIDWARQLAETLARVHDVPLDAQARKLLDDQTGNLATFLAPAEPAQRIADHPDGRRLWAALRAAHSRLPERPARFLHGDFWPGNTLWEEQRLVAVVDWEQPAFGHPESDLAYCRLDISLMSMRTAAAELVTAYEAASGHTLELLPFWDLYAAQRPMPDPVVWFGGYAALGRADLTPTALRENLRTFIGAALKRLDA